MAVLAERAREVGATAAAGGRRLRGRAPGAAPSAASWSTCRACAAAYDDVFLPLYGAHQAQNAVLALAAVEVLAGSDPLADDLVREAFGGVTSPGPARGRPARPDGPARRRPQPARRRPPLVEAVRDSFTFDPLIGVVGDDGRQGRRGLPRRARAGAVPDRVHAQRHRPQHGRRRPRRDRARPLRRAPGASCTTGSTTRWRRRSPSPRPAGSGGESIGSGGVLVTGSVVTVGEARRLLRRRDRSGRARLMGRIQRAMCAGMLVLQAVVLPPDHPGAARADRRQHRPWRSASGWA